MSGSRRHIQNVIVKTTVDIIRQHPRNPSLEAEPLVQVRGVVDLDPDPNQKTLPIYFNAQVQLFEDGTFDVFSFWPTTGREDYATAALLDVYRMAFEAALRKTRLGILGAQ
tara:strand:+ start:225 stop:557 length:333 start_codon:yes stop_codon:yes gene_type:complete